jgi:hypothetical protein
MTNQKIKRIILNIREDQHAVLLNLKEHLKFMGVSEVIRFLISEGEQKHLNNYREIAKQKITTAKTPEEKVKGQIERENMKIEARERAKLDKLEYFCRKVGGVCTADGYCEFNMFVEDPGELIVANKLREPIENMNDKSWEGQYFSSWASDKTAESRRSRIMEIGKKQKNLHVELPALE